MTTDKLAQTALDVLNALLPLLPVGAIVLVYRYFDKQSRRGRADDTKRLNELTAALLELWPLVTQNAVAVDMIAEHPAAYFTVSKHLAQATAKNVIIERLKSK